MNKEQETKVELTKAMMKMYRTGMKDVLVNIGTGCFVTAFIIKVLDLSKSKN